MVYKVGAVQLDESVIMNETLSQDAFLTYLLSSKADVNLSRVRDKVFSTSDLSNEATIAQYQTNYSKLEFDTNKAQHDSLTILRDQYKEKEARLKTRRYSVDFDSSKNNLEILNNDIEQGSTGHDSANEDNEINELRNRLLSNRRKGLESSEIDGGESMDRQIEDQDNVQGDLVENMNKLVHNLKDGAVAFQNALEEDKKVLGAAEIGIQVASRGLIDISGKLTKYDKKKLGYMFYISTFLFMFVGLIITFIIIKLFPAL